jgi:zinc transport system substrate-binding protein
MLFSCRRAAVAVGMLPLLVTVGCAAGSKPTGGTGTPTEALRIVAAFYPVQYAAERVAGDHAQVTGLSQPGAEPHDVELTALQVASVTTADLVVYEKTFQAAVDEAVTQSDNPHVLDTSTVVPLLPLAAGADNGHDHGEGAGLDPHVWLDPHNMITIADAIRDRLVAADPDRAADYRRNAAAFDTELNALDRAYADGLHSCVRKEFITTHAAFGYLARRYGLTQIGINGLSPDAEPSPARIAEIQHEATDHHLTTIFSETLVSPALAQSIAGDLGLKTDVLDPVEGITGESRGHNYGEVMTANLTALRAAGDCR